MLLISFGSLPEPLTEPHDSANRFNEINMKNSAPGVLRDVNYGLFKRRWKAVRSCRQMRPRATTHLIAQQIFSILPELVIDITDPCLNEGLIEQFKYPFIPRNPSGPFGLDAYPPQVR